MKKLLLLAITTGLIFSSCGGSDEEKSEDKDAEKTNESAEVNESESTELTESTESNESTGQELAATLDLSAVEIPLSLSVTENAEIDDKSYGTYIKGDESFNFEVIVDESGDYSVAERKEEMESNDMNKLDSYVVDEENGFIAKTKVMGTTEYHFFYIHTSDDGVNYVFEDVKGHAYTLEEAKLMYSAAKSAQ